MKAAPVKLLATLERDMLRALQYLYYVRATSLVEDVVFDEWQRQWEVDNFQKLPVGSDKAEDYTPAERALALYLATSTYVSQNQTLL